MAQLRTFTFATTKHFTMKKTLLLLLLLSATLAQSQSSPFDVNLEIQAYPTGLIPGLRLEKNFAEKNAVSLRLGYQLIDHRDLGKHDDETGSGYGFSLGYRRFFRENYRGLSLGLRNDFWWNEIDWETLDQNSQLPQTITGTTDIIVVQPTAELAFTQVAGAWLFTPTLSFGFEVNVKTDGEPTGEGAIVLLGINVGRRF